MRRVLSAAWRPVQVLSGMQGALQSEVGRDLQALQLADNFISTVALQLAQSPKPAHQQQRQQQPKQAALPASTQPPLAKQLGPVVDAPEKSVAPAAAVPSQQQGGATAWGTPAAPQQACDLANAPCPQEPQHMCWSIPAVAAAPAPALQQLQPLSQPCSPSWVAPPASQQWPHSSPPPSQGLTGPQQHGGQGDPGSGPGLRSSLGQMQGMLESVCALLQGGGAAGELFSWLCNQLFTPCGTCVWHALTE
jgi:hypothetical protein